MACCFLLFIISLAGCVKSDRVGYQPVKKPPKPDHSEQPSLGNSRFLPPGPVHKKNLSQPPANEQELTNQQVPSYHGKVLDKEARQAYINRLQKQNSNPLADPVESRTICREVPKAKALHFTYELFPLSPDVCQVRIEYHEHGTNHIREWETVTIAWRDQLVSERIPPQCTLRGVPYEFVLASGYAPHSSEPEIRIHMECDYLLEETRHFRQRDLSKVFLVLRGDVWDMRPLKTAADILNLTGDVTFLIAVGRTMVKGASRISPLSLIAETVITRGVSALSEKYGKVHIRNLKLHCALCDNTFPLEDPEIGRRIICPGCGANAVLTIKE